MAWCLTAPCVGPSCACCALGYTPGRHHSQPEHPSPASTKLSRSRHGFLGGVFGSIAHFCQGSSCKVPEVWTVCSILFLFLKFCKTDYFQQLCDAYGRNANLTDHTHQQRFLSGNKVAVIVQSLSHVQLFMTPWTAACRASLSFTSSQSLLKLTSIESVMPANHLLLCHPLLLPFRLGMILFSSLGLHIYSKCTIKFLTLN